MQAPHSRLGDPFRTGRALSLSGLRRSRLLLVQLSSGGLAACRTMKSLVSHDGLTAVATWRRTGSVVDPWRAEHALTSARSRFLTPHFRIVLLRSTAVFDAMMAR